ncbi:hypothetical protein C8R46DRAFT_1037627 [Mycena filopes]|nr:hypothetical protein C8R46DRAFT_1037627 [Mycena filopes]
MLHYPEVLEMSSFCPPTKSAARNYKVETEEVKVIESSEEESDADVDTSERDSSTSIQGSRPKERRKGPWPRLRPSETALIRFLTRHNITMTAISAHKDCLWAHSTVARHASKKNMAGKDEKHITDDFYRILAEVGSP